MITILARQNSSRLTYVLDWLFKEVLSVPYHIVTEEADVPALSFCIAYGKNIPGKSISIPDGGLLWEKDIRAFSPETGTWKNIPTLFPSTDEFTVPFDLFSALFYLLTRYEEYGNTAKDKHGRYPHTESILHKKLWLQTPLADEWIFAFYELLKQKTKEPIPFTNFSFLPTYDIDMAYSYTGKGLIRNAGGLVRDLLHGDTSLARERWQVLSGKKKDPFDCFGFLKDVHTRYQLQPVYFLLTGLRVSDYDKNLDPRKKQMQALIKSLQQEGLIGLHPSYYSRDEKIFKDEKAFLEKSTGQEIIRSRQHYIRMNLPETYRALLQQGIKEDYSMGYGSATGFRAGTGRSFYWYDLPGERQTDLRVHPFCFMDATVHYEEKKTAKNAFEVLNALQEQLVKLHSRLITVFHNFSLGTDKEWSGWQEEYAAFLHRITS